MTVTEQDIISALSDLQSKGLSTTLTSIKRVIANRQRRYIPFIQFMEPLWALVNAQKVTREYDTASGRQLYRISDETMSTKATRPSRL